MKYHQFITVRAGLWPAVWTRPRYAERKLHFSEKRQLPALLVSIVLHPIEGLSDSKKTNTSLLQDYIDYIYIYIKQDGVDSSKKDSSILLQKALVKTVVKPASFNLTSTKSLAIALFLKRSVTKDTCTGFTLPTTFSKGSVAIREAWQPYIGTQSWEEPDVIRVQATTSTPLFSENVIDQNCTREDESLPQKTAPKSFFIRSRKSYALKRKKLKLVCNVFLVTSRPLREKLGGRSLL